MFFCKKKRIVSLKIIANQPANFYVFVLHHVIDYIILIERCKITQNIQTIQQQYSKRRKSSNLKNVQSYKLDKTNLCLSFFNYVQISTKKEKHNNSKIKKKIH